MYIAHKHRTKGTPVHPHNSDVHSPSDYVHVLAYL